MNNPHTESSDSITTHEESARRIDALLGMLETERREVRRLKHEAVDLTLDYQHAMNDASVWQTIADDHRAAASRLRDERDKALSELEVLRNEDEFKRQLRAGANGDD